MNALLEVTTATAQATATMSKEALLVLAPVAMS